MILKYENVSKTIFMLEPCPMNQKLIIPDVWPIKNKYKESKGTGFESYALQYFCYFFTNNSSLHNFLSKRLKLCEDAGFESCYLQCFYCYTK